MEKSENELIAEFMELHKEYVHGETLYNHTNYDGEEWGYELHRLEYHKSWDWLMPVYKKCYDIWIPAHKEDKHCAEIFENIWQALWKADIETLCEEIVQFIRWYNSQTEALKKTE